MWTPPKNIVKDVPFKHHLDGQTTANLYVCISYCTGLPLYYRVEVMKISTYQSTSIYNFLSFEEAMLFCDLHGYWINTQDWNDPNIGLIKFYSPSPYVHLENGDTMYVGY